MNLRGALLLLLPLLIFASAEASRAEGLGHIEIKDLGVAFFKAGIGESPQADVLPLHDAPRTAAVSMPRTYLLDPAKFDDLTARYLLSQDTRETGQQLLLRNGFDDQTTQTAQRQTMNEYLRRIYQGYSAAVIDDSKKKQLANAETPLDVGRNILVTYQAVTLLPGLESRLGYDVIGNSTHFALVSPLVSGEFVYYLIDQKSPASLPEHVVTVDEAMDQFATFDRCRVNASHTFSSMGIRAKVMYGVTNSTLDYGISKSLLGPFAIQIVREDNYQGQLPNNLVFQLTLGSRF